MMNEIHIKDFNYNLPDERIAKFPLEERSDSKFLVYENGTITDSRFKNITTHLPEKALLIFNNTKVIRARMIFFKPTGARIEIFCLEPHEPADYERAFATKGATRWQCMIGNAKKWNGGELVTKFTHGGRDYEISARRVEDKIVEFNTNDPEITFGELLEMLGKIPIPPYLNRDSQQSDNERYQTVYSKFEGSVAAPTAGLHFTEEILHELDTKGFTRGEVTLHVGAGTFLPVKGDDISEHVMHTEHFDFNIETLEKIVENMGRVVAVGTTSVRTLESIAVLGYRALTKNTIDTDKCVGQWEAYGIEESGMVLIKALIKYMKENSLTRVKASTQIMITPQYKFKVICALITNFHQPQSTLLLLISAIVGEKWKEIYNFAMNNNYRFLSYGDSSLLKL
ncbi:MAG: S-adenosylmethionine:tRNA ribosyltransferase-isomerase [Rikenellaceae bacterium]